MTTSIHVSVQMELLIFFSYALLNVEYPEIINNH